MLVTVYQNQWITVVPLDAIRTDPTRMAQGIMTGIGFLGAGVIFKEGLTVRGLTTAASIWVTAAIGILLGIGFYFAATLGTAATIAILAAFRFIELRLPTEFYAYHALMFERGAVMAEDELRRVVGVLDCEPFLPPERRRQVLRVWNGDQESRPSERRRPLSASLQAAGSA